MFPGEARAEDPNRRYTTRKFMAWIQAKAGVDRWDLDAAADAESHHAPRWFSLLPYPGSAGVDGLAQSWLPPLDWRPTVMEPFWRIFVNPPFDDLGAWVGKAWSSLEIFNHASPSVSARVAMVLPGNRQEQPFWQEHVEPFRDGRAVRHGYRLESHFPPGRQAYAKPGSNRLPVGSAQWPSAVLVWRRL